jgi:hypothetical protein
MMPRRKIVRASRAWLGIQRTPVAAGGAVEILATSALYLEHRTRAPIGRPRIVKVSVMSASAHRIAAAGS